jgi:hypothetical protein
MKKLIFIGMFIFIAVIVSNNSHGSKNSNSADDFKSMKTAVVKQIAKQSKG